MARRCHGLLVVRGLFGGAGVVAVAEHGEQAARPVVAVERDGGRGIAHVVGHRVDVREERHGGVERRGGEGDPVDCAVGLRRVRADLQDRAFACAVDADRAVHVPRRGVAALAVRVVLGALVVQRERVIHVFDCDLVVGLAAPRNVVGGGRQVGVGAIPCLVERVEIAFDRPRARRVVHVVHVGMRAERLARIEFAVGAPAEVQMVAAHEFAQVGGAHVIVLVAERVIEVEVVDAQTVRVHHVAVVGHAARDPVVAAHGLEPPDLARIAESDAVAFVRAVFLEQRAKALHAFACAVDVRQHDGDEVFLANAAGHRGFVIRAAFGTLCGRVRHERVGAEHTRVRGDRLRGRHGHVRLVDAGFAPHAGGGERVRRLGVLQRIRRQVDRQMAVHAGVGARLVLRPHDDEFLVVERTGFVVFVAGDDRGAVVAGPFAYKDRCARHIQAFLRVCPA